MFFCFFLSPGKIEIKMNSFMKKIPNIKLNFKLWIFN